MKFATMYCLYDDVEYLWPSLEPFLEETDKVLFLISDVPWNGQVCDNSAAIEYVRNLCIKYPKCQLIQGHWTNEWDQRNYGLSVLYLEHYTYTFIVDNDEVYHDYHVRNIKRYISSNPSYVSFHLEWNTYWKKDYYCITPREYFRPLIAVKTANFLFNGIRIGTTEAMRTGPAVLINRADKYNGVLIPSDVAICYHMSYARDDAYMKRKLEINSHAKEFIPDWYDRVWKNWVPQMRHLHPVTPQQYDRAVPEDFSTFPKQLQRFIKKERLPSRKCSIIIPNWNSLDLLKECLFYIRQNTKRPCEIIVIDNGSKDGSPEYLGTSGVKYILNPVNLGFPIAINQGIKAADPKSDICILNVDTQVQDGWLENLYDTMIEQDYCGLSGPLGNECASGYQRAGYVSRDTNVPNLHGFCILILRELIEKIGIFDELYSPGGYEDNDYCMRAKIAGYRIYISAKSLVYHKAHSVYKLNGLDSIKEQSLQENKYYNKFFGILLGYSEHINFYSNTKMAEKSGLIR